MSIGPGMWKYFLNEYMNEHKQLLSFSPKTSTVTSDFNLFGDSAKKTNIWPIVFYTRTYER